MEDEVKNQGQQSDSSQEQVVGNSDYIEALKEMREKTVSKEAYDQLKKENAQLLKSLINGDTIEAQESSSSESVADLRKELFDPDGGLTNLEYAAKAVALREKLLAEGKPDPFLPYGHHIAPTNEDIEAADRVARILKECIDYADGDSSIFTSELQRVMVDAAPMRRK